MSVAHLSRFSHNEIRRFFRHARRVYSDPGIDILIKKSDHQGRILVITPRRVGNAPERNKIRRRIKALFFQNKWYERNIDCFAIIKKQGINYSYAQLHTIFEKIFESHIKIDNHNR